MIYRIIAMVSIWADGSGWCLENNTYDVREYHDFKKYLEVVPYITEWAKEHYYNYAEMFDIHTPEDMLSHLEEIGGDYKVILEMTSWYDEFSDPIFYQPRKRVCWNLWLSDICKWKIGLLTDEDLEKLANT